MHIFVFGLIPQIVLSSSNLPHTKTKKEKKIQLEGR